MPLQKSSPNMKWKTKNLLVCTGYLTENDYILILIFYFNYLYFCLNYWFSFHITINSSIFHDVFKCFPFFLPNGWYASLHTHFCKYIHKHSTTYRHYPLIGNIYCISTWSALSLVLKPFRQLIHQVHPKRLTIYTCFPSPVTWLQHCRCAFVMVRYVTSPALATSCYYI